MADEVIRRGAVVVCVLAGDFGKPRPAVVVQADLFNDTHASITVCPLTSELVDAPMLRVRVQPRKANGLGRVSDVMADKVASLRRERVAGVIGRLSEGDMAKVQEALRTWLELP